MDLTAEAVRRVSLRLELHGLSYDGIAQASATEIPFPDESFDLVFSHGVLHHIPDVIAAQSEISRVLRPEGRLVAMLYARRSLNYLVAISVVRRAAILASWPLRRHVRGGLLGAHLRNAEREGLTRYLSMERFVHASTDGPENPFARVYDLASVRRDFPAFRLACPQGVHARPTAAGAWRSSGAFDGLAPLGRARGPTARTRMLKPPPGGRRGQASRKAWASAQSAYDLDRTRLPRQPQSKGQGGAGCRRIGHQ